LNSRPPGTIHNLVTPRQFATKEKIPACASFQLNELFQLRRSFGQAGERRGTGGENNVNSLDYRLPLVMYRPIRDYAVIGDMHSAALVSSEGSIDWACLPYFDSPALFLRLLDHAQGGYCFVRAREAVKRSRRYLDGTNILETMFETRSGKLRLFDFMPIRKRRKTHPDEPDVESPHRIVRCAECVEGTVELEIEIKPTFSFASEQSRLEPAAGGFLFRSGASGLHVWCSHGLKLKENWMAAQIPLRKGENLSLVLSHTNGHPHSDALDAERVEEAFRETRSYWRQWSDQMRYDGEFGEMVLRSALVLKLLTFEPTGAIVAAPTTSLPEEIGGVRNWDYRYSWLRDSTFTLIALMNLGYMDEAHKFLHFVELACDCPAEDLDILFTVHGQRLRGEQELRHLEGYRGSKPVRIGNAAAGQKQLDVFGEVLDSIYLYACRGGFERFQESFENVWPMVERIANHVMKIWRTPDSGIWEVRSEPRHFLHSKGMCWVALDRAIRLGAKFGFANHAREWQHERDAILESICSEGYNAAIGAFPDSYGSRSLDASILRLPMLGVLDASSARMRSTIEQIERRLMRHGLVYRYLELDDGLPGGEATFGICTFWLVNNYALQGRLDKAEELFHTMLGYANDVGLYAEEIDPVNDEHLGNFPQGFTHIALINSAIRIAAARKGTRPPEQAIVEKTKRKEPALQT
jgi:GH15 family glucan-1,4-alpha-glucosidase